MRRHHDSNCDRGARRRLEDKALRQTVGGVAVDRIGSRSGIDRLHVSHECEFKRQVFKTQKLVLRRHGREKISGVPHALLIRFQTSLSGMCTIIWAEPVRTTSRTGALASAANAPSSSLGCIGDAGQSQFSARSSRKAANKSPMPSGSLITVARFTVSKRRILRLLRGNVRRCCCLVRNRRYRRSNPSETSGHRLSCRRPEYQTRRPEYKTCWIGPCSSPLLGRCYSV
mgnify:CR=1 FL=1